MKPGKDDRALVAEDHQRGEHVLRRHIMTLYSIANVVKYIEQVITAPKGPNEVDYDGRYDYHELCCGHNAPWSPSWVFIRSGRVRHAASDRDGSEVCHACSFS